MRNLGRSANRFLRRLGLEIRPVWQNGGFRSFETTKGNWVELLGPSGIGKTTLRKHVVEKEWSQAWNFGCPAASRMFGPCLLDNLYERLIQKKLQAVYQQNYATSTKLQNSLHFVRRLQRDRTIMCAGLWLKGGVFLDGGIMHNFGTQLSQEIDKDGVLAEETRFFFLSRVAVNLCSRPETVMARLYQRNKQKPGAGNDWITIIGAQLTMDSIRRKLEENAKLCQAMKQAGGKVFEIDMDQSEKVIIDQMRSVEHELISTSHERAERMQDLIEKLGKR